METVPITLGAVLPGTTGVPPLFGSAPQAHISGAGAFLQALQNTLAESYGGVKTKKVGEVVPENQCSRMHGNTADSSVEEPVTEPLAAPAPVQSSPNDVALAANTEGKPPQLAANIVASSPSPAEIFVNQSENLNPGKPARPTTASLAPGLIGSKIPQADTPVVKESSDSVAPEDAAQKTDSGTAQGPDPYQVPDATPIQGAARQKLFGPGKERITHSAKSTHLKGSREKTVNDSLLAALATVALEVLVANSLADTPVIAALEVSAHSKTAVDSVPTGTENERKAKLATLETGGTTPDLKSSTTQTPQMQQVLSAPETGDAHAEMKLFQLAAGGTLPNVTGTRVAENSVEKKAQLKSGMVTARTKESLPMPNTRLSSLKIQASISLTEKHDLAKQHAPLVAGHESCLLNPKSLSSDRRTGREFELMMPRYTDAKAAGPAQKVSSSTGDSNDSLAAATPAPKLIPADFSHGTGQDEVVPPQAVMEPGGRAPKPSPSLSPKTQAPAAVPLDARAPLSLPSERIQAARLIDRMGQAEMHLGMRTETFGSVQVHTVIRDSQVGLTIGSERGDLKSYLASEVSGLENNLREHDLHFADVRFVGQSFSAGGYQYGGAGSQEQSQQQGRWFPQAPAELGLRTDSSSEIEVANDETVGLSVHA